MVRAPQLRSAELSDLLLEFGSPENLLKEIRTGARRFGLSAPTVAALQSPDEDALDADMAWLSDSGSRQLVAITDADYPALLRKIPSPPAALFTEGDVEQLWSPQIAVVGSRNPTVDGVANARSFTLELVRRGFSITSGLARGIDGAAHAAALDAGGLTIAVAGTGLDRVYPASNLELASEIALNGVLVSEFPPGTPARRSHFPARNRIISGLSLGVLVIEAGLNSGSLITARLAAEQGREVFALPGSIHSPLARGCHRLIKQGARLVENCDDLVEVLGAMASELADEIRARLASDSGETLPESMPAEHCDPGAQWQSDPEYAQLWAALSHDPRPIDLLVERTGLSAQVVSSMVLMLELRGWVSAHPGGAYCKSPGAPENLGPSLK